MLVIVKSPLQIICAVEYIHALQLPLSKVSFVYLRKYCLADKQVYNTFKFYGINDFITIKFGNSNVINFFGFTILTYRLLPLKVFSKIGKHIMDHFARRTLFSLVRTMQAKTLVLGDPNYKLYLELVSVISSKLIVLLDDGLSSIELHYNYSAKNQVISFSFLREQAKNCSASMLNSFSKIKSLSDSIPDSDIVLFIGQPLYEANLISVTEMERLFREVGNLYPSKRIIYITHRWEQYISSFQFPANFEVVSNQDLPLELFISQINPLPGRVVSFYSSALVTLKKILSDEVTFSAFDIQDLISIAGLSAAYEKIRSYNIEVINLPANKS